MTHLVWGGGRAPSNTGKFNSNNAGVSLFTGRHCTRGFWVALGTRGYRLHHLTHDPGELSKRRPFRGSTPRLSDLGINVFFYRDTSAAPRVSLFREPSRRVLGCLAGCVFNESSHLDVESVIYQGWITCWTRHILQALSIRISSS